jgi:ribosomal protein S18 acetylase RimI-like enzyme
MISIRRATMADSQLLAHIGKISFIESHGHSASKEDIDQYVADKFSDEVFIKELTDTANIYHIISYDNEPAGYSKIILNATAPNIPFGNVTKMDRLYLLASFHDLKLGHRLLQFNIKLSQQSSQAGMWLYTWKENQRAVNFYQKHGFIIVGSHDFKISDTHANPNYQMLLVYEKNA